MTTSVVTPKFRDLEAGGKLIVNLHRGQARAWASLKRFVFIFSGTQAGKTCFSPHWLHREITKMGAGDYGACTATFPLLNLKMLPEFLVVFKHLLKLGEFNDYKKVFTVDRAGEISLFGEEQEVPTRIIFGSATNPESMESATFKAAYLDEIGQKQFRRGLWEAILRRLSLAQGRVLGTTTLYQLGWLKQEIFDPWEKMKNSGGHPLIDIIQFDSVENPAFPLEEYRRAQATLPDWKFQMMYRGRYAKPAGLVYDSFDDVNCVVDPFAIPKEWLRYVGHDFGELNSTALFFAEDPTTGFLYAYREYQPGKKSTEEQVEELKELSKDERILRRVGGSSQEEGWRGDYTKAGWPITKPRVTGPDSVEVQIRKVYGFNKLNRIYVFRNLKGYLDEKVSFARELDDNYQPTEKIENEDDFHLMAAERYIISEFDIRSARASGGKPNTKQY